MHHVSESLGEHRAADAIARFLLQFHNILVVLLAAGFVKVLTGAWIDAAVILSVVLINGVLGFLQEGKAEQALDSIRTMLSAEARCMRGGEVRLVPADELVPGDVVLLESGDKVPADLRLIEVKNLRTEEAALTGESVPVDKTTEAVSEKATVGDRKGMAFSGTLVTSGRGRGVVVATGADTELGRINQLMASVSPLDTPLLRQIKQFSYAITGLIAVLAVLLFAYGRWVRHMPFIDIFQAVVSATVSLIPEGLPTLITVTLAIGVQRNRSVSSGVQKPITRSTPARLYQLRSVRQGYVTESSYSTGYSTAPGFRGIKAQNELHHRYLTEDVGYSMVFLTDLARHLSVPTPTMDAVIQIASIVAGENFAAERARTMDNMGLSGLTRDQLAAF